MRSVLYSDLRPFPELRYTILISVNYHLTSDEFSEIPFSNTSQAFSKQRLALGGVLNYADEYKLLYPDID